MKSYTGLERLERLGERPATALENEAVFIDTERGEYQLLKGTALFIWELLEIPITMNDLCLEITEKYDFLEEQCIEDVIPFLEELEEIGLIKIHSQ